MAVANVKVGQVVRVVLGGGGCIMAQVIQGVGVMADKKGDFSGAFGLLVIIVIIVLMFTLAGGYRGGPEVAGGVSTVTQQVPASGNLTPQPDYYGND